jgi:hypothetical protein
MGAGLQPAPFFLSIILTLKYVLLFLMMKM